MKAPRICLVTIHGVGFEQPPIYTDGAEFPDVAGYADVLHARLRKYLGPLLSDDPERRREVAGENGPIYVESVWPVAPNQASAGHMRASREMGRSRLGRFEDDQPFMTSLITANGAKAALYDTDDPGVARISHVALVYAKEEGMGSLPLVGIEAAAMALGSLTRYASLPTVIKTLLNDFKQVNPGVGEQTCSLRVRKDAGALSNKPVSFVKSFENDVAAYVLQNDQRERIKGFVMDALLRLAGREDVDAIVVNGHSNGTVIAFDVLSQLPPFAARKIRGFVTAGSPLRKYAILFDWGRHIATIPAITREGWWHNFYDNVDPYADPLLPADSWRKGHAITPEVNTGFYHAIDMNTGKHTPILIKDKEVHNGNYSGGSGIVAHNYWDNEVEFIPELGKILDDILGM